MERRDYTPRRYDAAARTLAIDFALHGAGPATRWALEAKPGDTVQIAGPKGSAVVSPEVRRWLLVGDETALPAIGRGIEEAGVGMHLTCAVAVAGPADAQAFDAQADVTILWAHRPPSAADDPGALLAVIHGEPALGHTRGGQHVVHGSDTMISPALSCQRVPRPRAVTSTT